MKRVPLFFDSGPIMYLVTVDGDEIVAMSHFVFTDGKEEVLEQILIEYEVDHDGGTCFLVRHGKQHIKDGILSMEEVKEAGLLAAFQKIAKVKKNPSVITRPKISDTLALDA